MFRVFREGGEHPPSLGSLRPKNGEGEEGAHLIGYASRGGEGGGRQLIPQYPTLS